VVFSGHWVVQELAWLEDDKTAYHNAEHYGIAIDEVDVTDIKEAKAKRVRVAAK